uniref:Uncharacterized protein n=1 Tax=Sphaerodactylus townsendi TaxID=933632 RepID=A0ACB8GDZ7_9SAUR
MRSVHCTTAPANTEHQSPLLTIREEDIRPSSPLARSSGTSRDLCSDEEHEVQRDETLQRGECLHTYGTPSVDRQICHPIQTNQTLPIP